VTGFVYFIAPEALFLRDEDTQLVKIGYTRHSPESRLASLQCGSPLHLKVYIYTEGSQELERAFHEAFAPCRSHGEWFYLAYKLHDFMSYFPEPNGRDVTAYVPREEISVSLHDNVWSDSVPHPSVPERQWQESASFEPLCRFYPEVLES
jgi:hypothetical protein